MRTASVIVDAFPRRPLQLAYEPPNGRAHIGIVLLFVGALLADIFFFVPAILDDLRLGNSGVEGEGVRIDSEVSDFKSLIECTARIPLPYYCDPTVFFRTIEQGPGARISDIAGISPADKAGFKSGDIIVSVDGQAIERFSDLQEILAQSGGKMLAFEVDRSGTRITLRATPERGGTWDIYGYRTRNRPDYLGLTFGTPRRKTLYYLFYDFGGMEAESTFTVNYDPNDPSRISTSWGREFIVNRIVTQTFIVLLAVAVVWAGLLLYRSNKKKWRSLMAMAQNPRPVVARFVRVATWQERAVVHFTWSDLATGATRQDKTEMPEAMQPFWLDRERTTMLALAGPDGHALQLDEDLSFVELTDEELAVIHGNRTTPSV
jgi:PDZ domain